MSDQIHADVGQAVESGSRSVMSAGIVVVEQQALGSTVWAALAPLLEDLGQALHTNLSGPSSCPREV